MSPSTSPSDAKSPSDPARNDFLQGYIGEPEYARRRGVTLRTCQRDRQLRKAPPYIKLGRQIFYRVQAVREWMAKNECCANQTPNHTTTKKTRDMRRARFNACGYE